MKTLNRLPAVVLILFGMHTPMLMAQDPDNRRTEYRLELIYTYETKEFIFGIGNLRFKSISSLKRFIAGLPPGSTLEWAPGCIRVGNEPLLSSEAALRHFVRFCERKRIKFILVRSG
ncbi:MAG TPA: hypothetical protein VGV87_12325 [Blastocatellia bacterium]|nr:hypothetical protein [Blastocatellia bacterium]